MTHQAIVTGGSRGIGRGIVDRLVQEGADVLTCGRGERPADLAEQVRWVQADVAKPADADRIVATAVEAFGGVTLLVNNAGVMIEKTVQDSTDDDWDTLVGINCRGVFNLCRSVLPQMADQGGVIVNIGSISGEASDPTMALYNASKAFVHGLTRSIAVDHGPTVRCNAIRPGWVATEMLEDGFALADDPEAAQRDALARHPIGRFGQPGDIAAAVVWLASDEARFLTGECITIDGGLSAASQLNPGLL